MVAKRFLKFSESAIALEREFYSEKFLTVALLAEVTLEAAAVDPLNGLFSVAFCRSGEFSSTFTPT